MTFKKTNLEKSGSANPQRGTSVRRKGQKTADKSARGIAWQNKDIASKITGEAMIGRNLSPFGLPHIRVKDIMPTNLPVIESNELRLDNLFLLDDEAVAIIDYESDYEQEDFIKYLNYAARVIKRYAEQNRLDELKKLKIIVIYTADVEQACEVYDLDGVTVKVEPAYLTGMNTEAIYRDLKTAVLTRGVLNKEEASRLMILPLTVKGRDNKQEVIVRSVNLAKKISDIHQRTQVLAGLLTFTDKVIDEQYREIVKGELRMTQVERMIFEEAWDQGVMEGEKRGKKLGIKEGQRIGEKAGKRKGEFETLYILTQDGTITLKQAAARKGMTEKAFMREIVKLGLVKDN